MVSGSLAGLALETLHCNTAVGPLLAVPHGPQDMRILLFVLRHARLTALCESLCWVKPWARGLCASQKAGVLPGCNSMAVSIKRADFSFC